MKKELKKVSRAIKSITNEFSQFAAGGNRLDLAVGVVVGAAVSDIVKSAVSDVFMPLIGMFGGGVDITGLYIRLPSVWGDKAEHPIFKYGNFFHALMQFLVIAFCLFIFVKIFNSVRSKTLKDIVPVVDEKLETLKAIKGLLEQGAVANTSAVPNNAQISSAVHNDGILSAPLGGALRARNAPDTDNDDDTAHELSFRTPLTAVTDNTPITAPADDDDALPLVADDAGNDETDDDIIIAGGLMGGDIIIPTAEGEDDIVINPDDFGIVTDTDDDYDDETDIDDIDLSEITNTRRKISDDTRSTSIPEPKPIPFPTELPTPKPTIDTRPTKNSKRNRRYIPPED